MALTIYRGDSSSPSTHQWDYDVFLSFRGKDTRNGFTSYLCRALRHLSIKTFMDDDLKKGERIWGKLVEYINSSMISIIILSENYAFSPWCLDELVEILKCKQYGQLVFPVFYKVHPSEVREQKGNFAVALAEQHSIEKVQRWSTALREVASLSGWHYKDDFPEHELVRQITIYTLFAIRSGTRLSVAAYPVGVNSRATAIESLLDIEANDFRMVGIYGVGGIGKTTIACAVIKKIAKQFERSCFLMNVREISGASDSIIELQRRLLFVISMGKNLNVESVAHGMDMIKEWLERKRVLFMLDDVNEPKQIENLFGNCDSLVSRSRVLITTRDPKVLATLGKVCRPHQLMELNKDEALELLTHYAFRGKKFDEDCFEVANQLIKFVGGIPLDLERKGLDLCGRTKSEWEGAIRQYVEFGERAHKILNLL